MKLFKKFDLFMLLVVMISVIFPGILLRPAYGGVSPTCGDGGMGSPPFLAEGATPNLLLMIDNSGSMYDPAYTNSVQTNTAKCYDNNVYVDTDTYLGYFDNSTWYIYTTNGYGQFESTAEPKVTTYDLYAGFVCINVDNSGPTQVIDAFLAKGNFLNYAVTSKMDIEKEILTGGKYDDSDAGNKRLVLEARGCGGHRYVKQVEVKDAGGTTYYLGLGIRKPEEWVPDTVYPQYSVVTYDGDAYIAETGGTSTTAVRGFQNDLTDNILDWVRNNDLLSSLTTIEIYELNTTTIDLGKCDDAVALWTDTSPGSFKNAVKDCMSYGKGTFVQGHSSYNHASHDCWQIKDDKNINANDMMNSCAKVYGDGLAAPAITWDNPEYVCFGNYTADANGYNDFAVSQVPDVNYIGRCWDPGIGDWYSGDKNDNEACVIQAIRDFCKGFEVPEVIDPSDQADETGEVWNLPAILVDSGVLSQKGDPVLVCNGFIKQATAPEGLIHDVENDIRIAIMSFNKYGSHSECVANPDDNYIKYYCSTDAANDRDGSKIDEYMGAATADLVDAINDIKAESWTPIAEAMLNAIAFYTSNASLRLDASDFLTTLSYWPINKWCQFNNILFISDGASTVDENADVIAFATAAGHKDPDTTDNADCALSGSTYFDDLTYYAKYGTDLYDHIPGSISALDNILENKTPKNITTYIVAAGSLPAGTDECDPRTILENGAANGGTSLYGGTDIDNLENDLKNAFSAIKNRASAGSAASVISASRSGEGAVYQAIFWQEVDISLTESIKWLGEVHALLIDSYGDMYEDTNNNRTLDIGSDLKVILYFDETSEKTRACYGTLTNGVCSGTIKELDAVEYLWSTSDWLNSITDANIVSNRTVANFISTDKQRYIFTWNDLDNDGIVDSGETLPFTAAGITGATVTATTTRSPIQYDFGVETTAEVTPIVNWVRGLDQAGYRNRTNAAGTTWRLGDVIHSTPMGTAAPAEGYHLIYRDTTYGNFVAQYKKRRHMIYFGGNDGMLHAVNGGFYNPDTNKFCKTADCASEASAPDLGSELWAYVPYNLLCHLKCITDLNYDHKYYVDNRPRIFDVQAFDPADPDHPDGWGTILVGSMRFGGYKFKPGDLDLSPIDGSGDYTDGRIFTSAYFILDITDPEEPPELLAELTMTTDSALTTDLGYTTPIPTVVPMKHADGTSEWYLILGSGPTSMTGESTQLPKIAVIPLEKLMAAPKEPFRITGSAHADNLSATTQTGVFTLTGSSDGFVSDMVSVDFDLNEEFKNDAVYFGTIEGSFATSWSGKLYRLVTMYKDGGGVQIATEPTDWNWGGGGTYPVGVNPNPKQLISLSQPISASPSLGYDGARFWVYFGTGRYLHEDDKAAYTATQSYYGIKEPITCPGEAFSWGTVALSDLVRVDQIEVKMADSLDLADLSGTLPAELTAASVTDLGELIDYITGTGCDASNVLTGTGGWYRNFESSGYLERNLGKGILLGSLLTFTTYKPYSDVCTPEGESFLYGLLYNTGTSWHELVFDEGGTPPANVANKIDLGRGMSITPNVHSGQQEGTTAFVQTSTGAIVKVPQINPMSNYKTGRTYWQIIH